METTGTKTNETLLDNAKIAEKWFNDTNSAMKEIYNKQLNLSTEFYNNFINSTFGSNGSGNAGQGFNQNFLNNNLTKWMSTPLNGMYGNNGANSFFGSFDKTYKQLLDSNRNFFTEFYNKMNGNESEWSAINKEYIDAIEKRLETSKKMLDNMSETYNKQLNFSFEAERNMIKEMNTQFNSMLKQNQKFWSDILQAYQTTASTEDKTVKAQTETKKNALVFQ